MKARFPFFALAGAASACAVWYLFPDAGVWPLLLGLMPWAVRLLRTGRALTYTGFEFPLVLFLLTAGLSVWSSFDRETSSAKFWLLAGAVLLFYAFVEVNNSSWRGMQGEWIGSAMLALFGSGVTIYFLATHDWRMWPAEIAAIGRLGRFLQAPFPDFPGHRLHPNVAGGIFAFTAPFAGAIAFSAADGRDSKRSRYAGTLFLLLILFGLLMTTSRGAWLALALSVLLAGFYPLLRKVAFSGQRRRWLFATLLVVFLSLLPAGLWLKSQLARGILPELASGAGLDRLTLYRDSLALAQEYPFIGAGLGNFMMVYSTYQLLIHVGFSVHAHNLLLNVAIEQGMVAVTALIAAWVFFAGMLWKRAGPYATRFQGANHSTVERPVAPLAAAALALVTIMVHGIVDDPLYGSRAVILLFLPLAFVVPPARRSEATTVKYFNVICGTSLLIGLLGVLMLPPLRASWHANLGTIRQAQIELSIYSWPEWPIQDAVRRREDLSEAVASYERALVLNPRHFSANRRLGQIAISRGAYDDALRHLQTAYAQEPWDNATRQLMGEALIATGRVAEGRAFWATVNDAQNQLAAREFWYQHIGDDRRYATIKQALNP